MSWGPLNKVASVLNLPGEVESMGAVEACEWTDGHSRFRSDLPGEVESMGAVEACEWTDRLERRDILSVLVTTKN